MKNRNLIDSFVVAWTLSFLCLLAVGLILETRSLPKNIADYFPALMLFGFFTFAVVALAWAIVVVPCFFAAKKVPVLQHRVVAGVLGSALGFSMMFLLMRYLPVDQNQRPIFCTIATLVGLVSSLVLLRQAR